VKVETSEKCYTPDMLGSTIILVDTKGHVKGRFTYDALGAAYEGHFQRVNEYGYNGKRFDPAVALYDYGRRDYKPVLGRFTTLDPIRDRHNWYAFAANDPVNKIDVLGLCTAGVGGTGVPTEPTTLNKYDYVYPITTGTITGKWRCDQYASFEAFDQGYNGRDDYGYRINFDRDDIPEIYPKFKQQNKKDSPPFNSGGYVFSYFRGDNPKHMEFYKREGDKVTVWKTEGKEAPTPKEYTLDKLAKDKIYKKAKWVPRFRLNE
jgi:RHS repeat-associated protein